MKKILIISCLIISHCFEAQYYNGSNLVFGQNRVQYNTFFWQSYDYERFKIHFTKGGEELSIYTAKTAQKYLNELEKFLDYKMDKKLHFLIYNTQGKYRQSNIGLTNNITSNIGGSTKIFDEKIFIYFNGNHDDLNYQIKSGITEILLDHIFYGSVHHSGTDGWNRNRFNPGLSESIMNLPEWFKSGLINYLSKEWTTDLDNNLKDLILSKKVKKFNALTKEESILYGHGLWMYIDEVFGKNMIPNLIYMFRVSKSIESGCIYILGLNLNTIQEDYMHYYEHQYFNDESNTLMPELTPLKIKSKKNKLYREVKISPDGNKIAFVEHYLGQYKVKLYNLEKNQIKTLLKGDHKLNRIPDYSHPCLAWHPKGEVIAIFEEKKGEVLLNLYNTKTNKKNPRPLFEIQKVLSCSYNKRGDKLVMSACNNGQTDLFEYAALGNSQTQLTNDSYDNLFPKYLTNNTILFSSNRVNEKLNFPFSSKYDLYKISLDNGEITQVTNTPKINELKPQPINPLSYHFLSNKNGITNHYKSATDSTISHIDTIIHFRKYQTSYQLTNYRRNIIDLDINKDNSVFLYKMNGKFYFFKGDLNHQTIYENENNKTHFAQFNELEISLQNKNKSIPFSNEIDIYNYTFETEKINMQLKKKSKSNDTNKFEFKLPIKKVYDVNFSVGEFAMQLNPTFNNLTYQRFSNSGFNNSNTDAFTLIQLKDLYEDYKITAGVKGPVQINNMGFILIYENLKHRLDKKLQLSRQSFNEVNDNQIFFNMNKTIINDVKYQYAYPFNELTSLRFTTNLRYDQVITLSSSDQSLVMPNENHYLGGGLLEFVHDGTRPISLNINNGFRFKTWIEGYREFNRSQSDFFVWGFDMRNYQKIHRNIVFASRVAGSTSFGNQRLVYFLGGVDNWLLPRDQSVIFSNQYRNPLATDPNQNYQFQTIATPMRGFGQNARNGNSFLAMNHELRIPLFSYLSKKPLKSDFLEHFMLIGFGDVGCAWTGNNPYSDENAFNNTVISNSNYNITIQNQKEPFIYSYGWGIRSKLFGYYIRIDWGYGTDDYVSLKPIRQVSLSLDF